jgi:xylulose-5-phosphate/fructose-6-phosphate phosphoketolase
MTDEKYQISNVEIEKIDAYWRAANYLSVGELYLMDNPLLHETLKPVDIKKKIVGHWGTVPGQNFIYVHLNRVIKKFKLNMIYVSGPGHGGNAIVSQDWLDGSYTEVYPNISKDIDGMKKLFKQFSFPGGISSHVAPETPGSINEGGELGYSLAHAFGAVMDNPDLIAACVVGDGEAETGPLATAWHSNKFINPNRDGAVLPILHLNGYKISNPTIFARMSHEEIQKFFEGCGYEPYFVEGSDSAWMHRKMAETMEIVIKKIIEIRRDANEKYIKSRPIWPIIILRSPKGWTGPKTVDSVKIEGTFKAHQVPVTIEKAEHIKILEQWLKSYRPEELFNSDGTPKQIIRDLAPDGVSRMGANPHANGGILLKDLRLPDFRNYAVDVSNPGDVEAQDMMKLGEYIRDVFKLNMENKNFRIFGPDEMMSNRLSKIFEATNRTWESRVDEFDEYLSYDGRVMDAMLSEHLCQGWLEGYLLTGRHGIFSSYEAFIRIVDSMVSQHAKWLKVAGELPWRQKIASLNYLLSSHAWQQDHNGFTHQDPGFLDHVANKKADIVRLYLPPDGNCALCVLDECIKSRDLINVMIVSKHPQPQWLTMEQAVRHCSQGIGIWQWASNDAFREPDAVMACCGDTPTLETLAAVKILRDYLPDILVRVINVVDLMKLQPSAQHPHGLSDADYDALFTKSKPIVFAFHGYATLIHELTYKRTNKNIHVRGYQEEGTITTPFDMRVQNKIDRFTLVMDVVQRLPQLGDKGSYLIQKMRDKLIDHSQYISEYGIDMPEIREWKW